MDALQPKHGSAALEHRFWAKGYTIMLTALVATLAIFSIMLVLVDGEPD